MDLWTNITDPIAYADRLTMPKLVVNSGMDEFFMPDDTHWWWDKMPGPKHFLMTPNTDHICATGVLETIPAIGAFIKSVLNDKPAPTFTWKISSDASNITVDTKGDYKPHSVHMWHATTCNADRRDFRAVNLDQPCACGVSVKGHCLNLKATWSKTVLTEVEGQPGIFVAHQDAPAVGWTAFFIDVQYGLLANKPNVEASRFLSEGAMNEDLGWPIDFPARLEFTTEVSIIPNTFPFKDCTGKTCNNKLV
jgi:PhoPQ-activated pathogenicity-related protein